MRSQVAFNGKMNEAEISQLAIEEDALKVLDQASLRFGLSLRAINKVKKVSRTIADLDDSDNICKKHILEALSFRRRR